MRAWNVIGRFIVSVIVTATLVTCAGRVFSDFDEPASMDPHDLARGVGVWLVAVLVAVLNELQLHRRRKRDTASIEDQ